MLFVDALQQLSTTLPTKHSWQWDVSDKENLGSPDSRQKKVSNERLWVRGLKPTEWATEAGGNNSTRAIRGDRFQKGRDAGTAQKRLPRLNEANDIDAFSQEPANVLPLLKSNDLMHMFVKRKNMIDARHVFDNVAKRNVVSWNIMILGYAKQEEGALALELYARMLQEGVQPSARTFVGTLKACSVLAEEDGKQGNGKCAKMECMKKGRVIHSQVVISGFELDMFVGTALLDMYAKFESLDNAQCVFDEFPHRNVVSWNVMILGYSKQGEGAMALDLYARMQQEGLTPDHRTFVGAFKACDGLAALEKGNQVGGKLAKVKILEKVRAIYSQLVQSGFESDVFIGNTSVDMFTRCGSMNDAQCIFDELPCCSLFTWTTMILGYAQQEDSVMALMLYAQMQKQGLSPDSLAFVAILKACGSTAASETGKEVHTQINMVGLENTLMVANSLIDMYAKCGAMDDAQELFDALPRRDIITWNSLIAGYARQGKSELVFHLFEKMSQESIEPDRFTFLSVLNVCNHVGLLDKGHSYLQAMSKHYGIIPTIEHYTCMVDLLCRAGQVNEAVVMVDKMPAPPDDIVWLTILAACQKWKNVGVGRYAFKNLVRLGEKYPSAYVLMSNLYADACMWADCDWIQVSGSMEEVRTELVD